MVVRDIDDRRHTIASVYGSRNLLTGLFCPLLALIGLYLFSSSFFLAKRSMPYTSTCSEAQSLLQNTLGLTENEIKQTGLSSLSSSNNNGCWTDRRVDSMVILLVDALRFDFALHHLPMSVGARLFPNSTTTTSSQQQKHQGRSQLLRFVADPPTVTMQRLKGLTTGGLPTFADISASFGGATVDEDSWVQQLVDTDPIGRGVTTKRMAFVGDDTWIDLFPTQFEDSHPFPSFNTRDLDSVDNGCLEHLPRLMESLRRDTYPKGFEVVIAHFLGVDHVGHTYGPHNIHMDEKLRQMDVVISTVLDVMDDTAIHSCHVALIFGDHGMTEGGNHGGGTQDEVNAALFAHFSPGCGDMRASVDLTGTEAGSNSERAFQSIRQIDLVPTVSILLGLPIPYANIGGLVPSLLPPSNHAEEISTPQTALALALNAAQVWRYFTMYSQTANKLPSMPEMEALLKSAVSVYRKALEQGANDSMAYREACGKFKLFLMEAAELGIRVWTRFDNVGMIVGFSVLLVSVMLVSWYLVRSAWTLRAYLPRQQLTEVGISSILMIFYCVLLTFSNSYIDAEQHIGTFAQAVICLALCARLVSAPSLPKNGSKLSAVTPWLPIVIPLCSRLGELFVSGHGLDPSIPVHRAHNAAVFMSSLTVLAVVRLCIHRKQKPASTTQVCLDVVILLLLGLAWIEKRSSDTARNGFLVSKMALALLAVALALSIAQVVTSNRGGAVPKSVSERVTVLIFRLLTAIMAVTGPSTASSVVLFIVQALALQRLGEQAGSLEVSAPVLAALWRLTIRHLFFSTNHSCAFNRLQYSAAFVATDQFYFVTGGISLFLNTFGWEIVGLVTVSTSSYLSKRPFVWKLYCFYQLLETLASCVSVSLFRRHLMVWAIFAPRFIFAGIFLILNSVAQVILYLSTN